MYIFLRDAVVGPKNADDLAEAVNVSGEGNETKSVYQIRAVIHGITYASHAIERRRSGWTYGRTYGRI